VPYRHLPIIPDQVYHIYNRSIARQPIFLIQRDYQRLINLIHYYSFLSPPLRFSHFNRLDSNLRQSMYNTLIRQPKRVSIYAFCLMPNHFHFLVSTTYEKGISQFLSDIQNSYAKYFNTRHERSGALFQSMFKAVRIETDEQFLHVARYIHLNPFTSYVVKSFADLETWSWSSLFDYIKSDERGIIDRERLMDSFKTVEKFKKFIFDQADYQRNLDDIKHLLLE